ncbi:hypothetical protein [Romboutsia sp.]|uniref:hypothetical protein n=1 Tax=Romboutsia sp. TaxID=1965302 RepID=UPI002D0117E4|nr:hypothetical protein [Romboutsia sp.]HSQ90193.1 hypothetical protein [Romboutsia sp.]
MKNPFKVGDVIIVKRASTPAYNGVVATITEIIGRDNHVCRTDKKDLGGCDLLLEWQKLDLYKEVNEI